MRTGAVFPLGKRLATYCIAWALFCGACLASAQEAPKKPRSPAPYKLAPYAVIFGTVWDADSHPVYGVHVLLRRSGEKKIRWEAYADHRGEFAFRVPPGKSDYELMADKNSLKMLKNNNLANLEPVKVHVEFDEQVDTGLHLTK